jgi:AcrR family transcriptional regulator
MKNYSQAPTGLARRGRRRSEAETEHRMLGAAVAMVRRTGLTVSMDNISLEDVIRDAGVSRSAVYRRWPYKDLFISDLVKELAEAAVPSAADHGAITDLIKDVVVSHKDWVGSAEGRHALLLELFRQTAVLDFESLYGSPEWRTYLALHATFMSLAEGELRQDVQATLARSQKGFIDRVARAWAYLAGLFGYQLRPELGAGFEVLATLVGALSRGLVLMSLSMPELVTERRRASPFGAANVEEWSLPALGFGSMAFGFFEPDPSAEWDEDRVEMVKRALATVSLGAAYTSG